MFNWAMNCYLLFIFYNLSLVIFHLNSALMSASFRRYFQCPLSINIFKEAKLVLLIKPALYKTSSSCRFPEKLSIFRCLVVFVLMGSVCYNLCMPCFKQLGGIHPSQTMNVLENMLQNRKYDSEKKLTQNFQNFWKANSIRK